MKWLYLYISWIVALIATFGSIYLSEVENVTPCPLCWYQRVCMFPLIFILGIAVYKHFYRITIYILPQVIIGWLIALYQSVETYFPHILPLHLCRAGGLCYEEGANFLNIFPLSLLSLLAFTLLLVFSFLNLKNDP